MLFVDFVVVNRDMVVEYQSTVDGTSGREFVVIANGLSSLFVAVQAEVPDFDVGDQIADRINHSQASSKNRNRSNSPFQFMTGSRFQRRCDIARMHLQIACAFRCEDCRKRPDMLTKSSRLRVDRTESAEVVMDDCVIEFVHLK